MGKTLFNDGVDLKDVEDQAYDFCFSRFCLEHIANPIKALKEWRRVLVDKGYLVVIVPEKSMCFDRRRKLTTFATIKGQYDNDVGEDDMSALPEILKCHVCTTSNAFNKFKEKCTNNPNNRCLHHHVYSEKLLREICLFIGCKCVCTDTIEDEIWLIARKVSDQ